MLKPTKISTVRAYLTVLGLQMESSANGFEVWEGQGKSVLICVSETIMPVFPIQTMLSELNESSEAFVRITAVIK